jgi:hypothetical protein
MKVTHIKTEVSGYKDEKNPLRDTCVVIISAFVDGVPNRWAGESVAKENLSASIASACTRAVSLMLAELRM